MPVRITFELSEQDLRQFRRAMRQARAAVRDQPAEAICTAARDLLEQGPAMPTSGFVAQRLAGLRGLLTMLEDPDWSLPGEERARVLAALAYFAEERDLVPDSVPGLGFIDDAIMIELVLRDLRHEIESYADFCRYREAAADPGDLADRRRALQARSRRRRRRPGARPRLF